MSGGLGGRPAFTLIELAIVVGLVALLLTLAWPSLEGTLATERLQASGRQLEALIRDARRLALQNGVDYCIEADYSNGTVRARPDYAMEAEPLPPGLPGHSRVAIDEQETGESVEFVLPDGVRFLGAESDEESAGVDAAAPEAGFASPEDRRTEQMAELPEADAELVKGRWRIVCRVYADGSADAAVLTLYGRAGACVECRIDPLTALVRLRDLRPDGSPTRPADSEKMESPIRSEARGLNR